MKIGIIIACSFATIWWIIGIWAAGSGSALLTVVPFVISAAIVVAAMRHPASRTLSSADSKRIGRLVGIASGIEGGLIGLTFATVGVETAIPIMAIIVGLHFVPLAYWIPAPPYYATGAVMTAIGLAALGVANVDQRVLFVCIGCACVLWLTCLFSLRPGRLASRTA